MKNEENQAIAVEMLQRLNESLLQWDESHFVR